MLGRTAAVEIRTPEGVSFRIPLASPYARCLAYFVDLAVTISILGLVGSLISIFSATLSRLPVIGPLVSDFGMGLMVFLQFAITMLYGIVLERFWSGQTVGKRLFRLRVVDERGLALGTKQVILRNLFRILDSAPLIFYFVGGISCFLTRRCQRIGDVAAGTIVVREAPANVPEIDSILRGGENSFAAAPHLEARLRRNVSPEEARIAYDAVLRRDELDPAARVKLFARLAEHFRERTDFPEELTLGLSDEQYVRNVVDTLYRRAAA